MNKKGYLYSRPWGSYLVLEKSDTYLVKMLRVNPMQKLSLQSHNCRAEHWVICSGIATVIKGNFKYTLLSGQSIDIKPKEKHSLQNLTETELCVLELQMGDKLSEEDIVRYEDMYGRL